MDQKELVLLIFENSGLQPLFFWGTRKRTASWNRSLAPNCGYGKSIELSYANLEVEQNHITELKNYLIIQLKLNFQILKSMEPRRFYTVLNVLLPFQQNSDATVSFRHERNCGFAEVFVSLAA
jgi:cysteine desulfurase